MQICGMMYRLNRNRSDVPKSLSFSNERNKNINRNCINVKRLFFLTRAEQIFFSLLHKQAVDYCVTRWSKCYLNAFYIFKDNNNKK